MWKKNKFFVLHSVIFSYKMFPIFDLKHKKCTNLFSAASAITKIVFRPAKSFFFKLFFENNIWNKESRVNKWDYITHQMPAPLPG